MTSLGKALHEALAGRTDPGTVEVQAGGRSAEVDLVEADRIGVRVRRVKVTREEPVDVNDQARDLPDRLGHLDERIVPVEVAPALGGAIFRTAPEDVREREFYEVGVTPTHAEVRRYKTDPERAGRDPIDWAMTKKQLEGLVDDLG